MTISPSEEQRAKISNSASLYKKKKKKMKKKEKKKKRTGRKKERKKERNMITKNLFEFLKNAVGMKFSVNIRILYSNSNTRPK